ncbi:hypothetical protein [Neobacillus sp. D3-1R]|uniref:hypothetical protein n=1 Tax=Neobacillus sp. D3-1R TaxID=3445778 RepID=UPI003F9ED341
MNAQQWIYPLLKMMKNQMNFKIVRKKKSGRGMIWASLLSVVFSAIALNLLNRGKKSNTLPNIGQMFESMGEEQKPVGNRNEIKKKYDKKYDINNFLNMNDKAVLAEFSSELAPKNNSNEHQNQSLHQDQQNNNPKQF